MHLRATSAKRTAIKVKLNGKWYIVLCLRLPFGGSSCPANFCLLSDIIIADIVNNLMACKSWDESKVRSEFATKVPEPEGLDDTFEYATAREFVVKFPV